MSPHIKTWEQRMKEAGSDPRYGTSERYSYLVDETADLRAALELSRRPDSGKVAEGLEQAARVCDSYASNCVGPMSHAAKTLAGSIRSLAAPAADSAATEQAESREARIGRHVLEFARRGGWQDDGEGAFEFIQRHSYVVGFEDAGGKIQYGTDTKGSRWPISALAKRSDSAAEPFQPDYSEMSREALERHAARMAQALANDKPRQFYDKYATGPMMPPSCLCCGQLPDKVAIQHAELPGIVVCEKCRAAPASADVGPTFQQRVAEALSIKPGSPTDDDTLLWAVQAMIRAAERNDSADVVELSPDFISAVRGLAFAVAEDGIKAGSGSMMSVASDKVRVVVDAVLAQRGLLQDIHHAAIQASSAALPKADAAMRIKPIAMVFNNDDVNTTLHVLRNPHGFSNDEVRVARRNGADLIEQYRSAYENMRQFAESNGLDVTSRAALSASAEKGEDHV